MSIVRNTLLLSAGAFALANGTAFTQETLSATEAEARQQTIIVTGIVKAGGQNRLDSSISVSSLNQDELMKTAPRSTAEIFRALPGIRAESSAGGGNSNIAVRGMPLSTGGAKYVSLQEDCCSEISTSRLPMASTKWTVHLTALSRFGAVRPPR